MFQRPTAAIGTVLAAVSLASLVAGCGHVLPAAHGVPAGLMAVRGIAPATSDDDDVLASVTANSPRGVGHWLPAGLRLGGGAAKPAVLSMPSPNQGERSAAIDTLIMHHTSSTAPADRIGAFFQNPKSKVSAHYTVGKDGTIVQSVPDQAVAWHAGVSAFLGRSGVNAFSIGIEMCNVGDGNDPYTDAQYHALGQLVAYILDEHHIKWDHVTGHKDIALPKGRKDDPSPNFSYERMKQEVLAVDPHAGE